MHESPHSAHNCCSTKTLRAPCPSTLPRVLGWYSELRGREDEGNKVCVEGRVDINTAPSAKAEPCPFIYQAACCTQRDEVVQWDTAEDKYSFCAYWNNRWTQLHCYSVCHHTAIYLCLHLFFLVMSLCCECSGSATASCQAQWGPDCCLETGC